MPDAPFSHPPPPENALEAVEQADVELGAVLASQRDHPAVKAGAEVGKVGDQGPLYAISAFLVLLALVSRRPHLRRAGTAMLAAVAAADAAKRLAKHGLHRTRPYGVLDQNRPYRSGAGGADGDKPEQSFPSGHMAGTLAVARALSRYYPRSWFFSGPFTAVIAVARIIKGAHWPLDVLAGLVIGWLAELGSNAVVRRLGWGARR